MKNVTYIGHGEFGNARVVCGKLVGIEVGRTDFSGQTEYIVLMEKGGVNVTIPSSSLFAVIEGHYPMAPKKEWVAFNAEGVMAHMNDAINDGAAVIMKRTRKVFVDNREDRTPPKQVKIGKIGQLILKELNAA